LRRVVRHRISEADRSLVRGVLTTCAVTAGFALAMGATFTLLPNAQHQNFAYLLGFFRSLTAMFLPAIVGYALLRYHLFDIDLKVKSTLRQSVAAGFLAVIFFVVSNGLQFFFPAANLAFAIVVAAVVAAALWPAERLAKRLMDRWMPGVGKTPGYLDARRRDLYESALAEALSDGKVTARERRLLERLRRDLGISMEEATDLEDSVAAGPNGTPLTT
jgi:hypothetical protein